VPRGIKSCPQCNKHCSAASRSCSCGFEFKNNKKPSKAPSFFQERKDFIKRMLDDGKSSDYKLDIMTASKIFKSFNNDIDFLSKVKPPFKLQGSIKYFLTKDGLEYLKRKHKEFYYKPINSEKMVDLNKKVGEDIVTERRKTLRDFLDE